MSLTISRGPQPNPNSQPNDGAPGAGLSMSIPEGVVDPFGDREALLERIVSEMYMPARDHWQEWRQETATCYDFVAGHQWEDDDLQILRDQLRPAITFNRIGPFIDSVEGLEVNNRQETQYIPRQVGKQGVNDLLTGAAQWVRQECDAEDEETESFKDAVICGLGCVQTRMDYDDDPDGMIVLDRIDPLEMLPDPTAQKGALSDARFVIRVKDIPIPAAMELFPHATEQDLHAQWAEDDADAAKSPHNARLAPYYRIDQSGQSDRAQQMVRMVEVEWWDYERAWRVFDASTGRFVLLDVPQYRLYMLRCKMAGMLPLAKEDRRKRYWKAICGSVILKLSRGADQGGFQYKFITGKRDRNRGTWYGLVRAMLDPQLWANKFLSQSLHIVNTNAKGGLLAETDAFVDIDEARDSWADADSITELNPGGLSKIKEKEPPTFPAQISNLMEFAISSIPQVNGINPELMGQTTSNQPQAALLEHGRRQQGMNVLAGLFNSKRRYQKEQGRLMLWMIQTFISDGRLIRIGGPEEMQYVPLVHQPGLAEYDVIVDDAPTSPNMKERVWGALMQLFPMLSKLPLPPTFMAQMLKWSPLPATAVAEIQQATNQPPPVPPGLQGKMALDQAKAAEATARAGVHQAMAQKLGVEAQMAPQQMDLETQERAARVESLRANAAAALTKAGVQEDDSKFAHIMGAVDALLRSHGAALQHVDQMQGHLDTGEDQALEAAKHRLAVHQVLHPPAAPPNAQG